MRKFVMGDIHGSYKALLQCLERSGFNKEEDELIQLGDVCDGWSEVYECVEELLTIKNLITIRGNHDQWFYEFIRTGIHGSQWTQGADATRDSYGKRSMMIPESHEKFFGTQMNYYVDEENRCFVHGGFNRHLSVKDQTYSHIYYWDRDLWYSALSFAATIRGNKDIDTPRVIKTADKFKEIYIGHTATTAWDKDTPMQAGNIWNLDTGAGFKGRLTIMDIDTKEFWQSDPVQELYKNEKGRN